MIVKLSFSHSRNTIRYIENGLNTICDDRGPSLSTKENSQTAAKTNNTHCQYIIINLNITRVRFGLA